MVTFGPDGFTGHPDHQAVSPWTDLALGDRRTAPAPAVHAVTQGGLDPELVDEEFGVFALGEPRICTDEELALRLPLEGAPLERKVDALLRQTSQTGGLVDAVGRDRFSAWVATESFAPPLETSDAEPLLGHA